MYTYPIQQHKYKNKGSFPKCPDLHVDIPSTTKKNINKKDCFQNDQSCMCTYPLQQQQHKYNRSLP